MPLCIKLKRHGQDDGIVTLQKQETSKERQNLKIVDSRIQCASTIFLSVITESPATAGDNIPTVHTGTKYSKDHGRKYPPKDKKTNKPRSVYSDILCYNCNGKGHIACDCCRGQMQKPNVQGSNYHRQNFKNQGYQSQQNSSQNHQNEPRRENDYQGYKQSTLKIRGPSNIHKDRYRQNHVSQFSGRFS